MIVSPFSFVDFVNLIGQYFGFSLILVDLDGLLRTRIFAGNLMVGTNKNARHIAGRFVFDDPFL